MFRSAIFSLSLVAAATPAAAQQSAEENAVRAADEAFWRGFNGCDAAAMGGYFSDDVEFYHDLTGLTAGRLAVVESLHRGPCSTPGRVRREPVAWTIRFDPIPGYGAMPSGEHRFYVSGNGQAERPSGQARFAHVWRSGPGGWRMHQVLSYAHGPAAYVPPRAVEVPAAALQRHASRYRGPNVGEIDVTVAADGLRLVAGSMALTLRPASETEYFAVERDLRFRFKGNRLVVIENGAEVEAAARID